MRFGRGHEVDVVDPHLDWNDDALWEATRGRRDVRRSHDPLVRRVLELRAETTASARQRLDALKYGPVGRRADRLRRRRDLGGRLTSGEAAEVADYERRLEVLYAELDRGRTRT